MVLIKKKTYRLVLLNLLVFVISFVVIDYFLGRKKIPYDFNRFRVKHPYYHHGMLPNITQYTVWGNDKYKVFTNTLGMRDSAVYEVGLKKNERARRILIMGDSHTEGVGVRFEDTFAGILQEKAKKYNTEILNGAAVSYSQKIYFLRSDHIINNMKLDLDEIWVLMDISDMQNEIAYDNFQPEKPGFLYNARLKFKDFLEHNSFTFHTIKARREKARLYSFLNKVKQFDPRYMDNLQKNTIAVYEDFFRDFDDDDLLRSPQFHGVATWYQDSSTMDLAVKGINLGMRNMEKLDSICKNKGIKLRIAVHPWHAQIKEGDTMDYYVSTWKKFCLDKQVDFINLFPLFINEENPFHVIDQYYIRNDNHWNARGHERVANYLIRFLGKENRPKKVTY